MPPDESSRTSQKTLEYETSLPKAWRVVTIPRGLYAVHRVLAEAVEAFSVVYGIGIMCVGWLFKSLGVVFVVAPKRPAA